MATLPDNMLATAELLASVKSPLGSAALRRPTPSSDWPSCSSPDHEDELPRLDRRSPRLA
jgi:hypothetical protein